MSAEERLKLDKHCLNLSGAIEEEKFFKSLRSTLEQADTKDAVVINGWKDNGFNETKKREFDFLIVSHELRSVIHIEAKKSFSAGNFRNASVQLDDGLGFMRCRVPIPGKQNWQYVRMMYFAESVAPPPSLNICPSCQMFIITPETNLSNLWQELSQKLRPEPKACPESSDTYLDILKFLLHQMFIQEDCITDGDCLADLGSNFPYSCNGILMIHLPLLTLSCMKTYTS